MNRPEFQNQRTLGADLERLLREVRTGRTSSGDELCRLLRPGVQFLVARHSKNGNHAQVVDKVLKKLLLAIGQDQVRDVAELLRCARMTIMDANAVTEARGAMNFGAANRASSATRTEFQFENMRAALAKLPGQEREILRRYYVLGQTEDQIVSELQLSRAEFQELKVRARTRLQNPDSSPA